MIDIHCHILPDLDDGASDLDEALEMARIAARSGITDIIATPHFRGEPESVYLIDIIKDRCREFQEALDECKIPIRVHQGAEILCTPDTPDMARQGELPTLGDTDYVLIEFYFDESFRFMDSCFQEVAAMGYVPVVAHPERYKAVQKMIQRDPQQLVDWAERGYVFQINKGSVLGTLGKDAQQAACALLEMGLVHIFASDAHNCEGRTPYMRDLRRWAKECCTSECARIWLKENPKRILENQPMVAGEPEEDTADSIT